MSKIRVYEYAKQNNTSSKEIINYLTNLNIEVSNHMSTISDDTVRKLDEKFNASKSKQAQPDVKNSKNNPGSNQAKKHSNPSAKQGKNHSQPKGQQQKQQQTNKKK